jgi:hypothetical protein
VGLGASLLFSFCQKAGGAFRVRGNLRDPLHSAINKTKGEFVMRGTSNAPLILGIVGSILMLPGIVCSVCVGGTLGSLTGGGSGFENGVMIGLIIGLLPVVLGIVGAVVGKSRPDVSFVLLLLAGLLAGFAWFRSGFVSLFSLASFIVFIVGAILAKTQKKEAVS